MALTPRNKEQASGPGTPETPELSTADEMALREIDDAVRQDDAAEFAQKYGVLIGSVVFAVLAGLAGYLFWDARTEASLEKGSETLVGVLDYAQAQDFPSVKERTEPLLDSETIGVRLSARFLQAQAALQTGEQVRASELYSEIAADEEAPQALRDFATLREVAINFDDREPADIIEKLKDLAVPGHPLYGSAAEMTAFALRESGETTQAGELFAAIAKDEDLPLGLRDRARQMTGQLGVDSVDDVAQVLEDQGIPPQGAEGSAP